MCEPLTVNEPLPPETVPVVVVPSPQSTVATNSPGPLTVLSSVKVATVTLVKATLGSPWMVVPDACRLSVSATVTVPEGAMVALSVVRVIVTVSVNRPSSA